MAAFENFRRKVDFALAGTASATYVSAVGTKVSAMRQTHGVIGNTADFDSVIQGSSPCGSATYLLF